MLLWNVQLRSVTGGKKLYKLSFKEKTFFVFILRMGVFAQIYLDVGMYILHI